MKSFHSFHSDCSDFSAKVNSAPWEEKCFHTNVVSIIVMTVPVKEKLTCLYVMMTKLIVN